MRGCYIYIPADELVKAGIDPYSGELPTYRVWGRRGGSVLVRLYGARLGEEQPPAFGGE